MSEFPQEETTCDDGSESIQCPNCGDFINDLWDHFGHHNDTEIDCDCGAVIEVQRDFTVYYTATVKTVKRKKHRK